MRILLIYPAWPYSKARDPLWMPLGLSYIASYLSSKGHQVKIFDRYAQQVFHGHNMEVINAEMMKIIKSFCPDIVGLNSISPVIYDTVECIKRIRESYRGVLIAGGHHASALPEITLRRIEGLDGVIQGEGEVAFAKLAAGEKPAAIAGMWWKNGNSQIHMSPPEQIRDLDILPFPDLNLLDMAFYTRPTLLSIRGHYLSTLSILTSRGCRYSCSFCTEPLPHGKGVRFHSLEYVMELLRKIAISYDAQGLYFHDTDFLTDIDRAEQFCQLFIRYKYHKRFKWAIQTRANRINPQIAKLLKRSGCVLVELGVESSLQRQLNEVNKQLSVTASEKAIKVCQNTGLKVHLNIIVGFNQETIADLNSKIDWVKRHNPDSFEFFRLLIHPGSQLYTLYGNAFFENLLWSRRNVSNYYLHMAIAAFTNDEYDCWCRHSYQKYRKWHWRKMILLSNPKNKVAKLAIRKINADFKRSVGI